MSGLNPATVDVLLSTLDQQSPKTARPIGRLSRLVNAVVKKYMNPRAADGTVTHVRVEKRDAFIQQTTTCKDLDGAASSMSGTPQVLFDGGDAEREVAGNRLFTKAGHWIKASNSVDGDTIVLPQTLRQTEVYTADSQADAPDIALIGDVACIVWREVALAASSNAVSPSTIPAPIDGVRATFINAGDRSVIRPAFNVNPFPGKTYLRTRVVADGTYFWVIQDHEDVAGTAQFDATIFDINGTLVDSQHVAGTTNNLSWDATFIPGRGVTIATAFNGAGVRFIQMTYAAAAFTNTIATDATIKQTPGQPCCWLTETSGASNVAYLATGYTPDSNEIWAYKIVSQANAHEYPVVASALPNWTATIAGYNIPSSTSLVVGYTIMDLAGEAEATRYGSGTNGTNTQASNNYPNQLNNATITRLVPFTGSSSLIVQRFAMSIASRAFAIGADYCCIGYYPGVKFGPLATSSAAANHFPQRPANPSNFQPTWYVLPLASKQKIAGRFEYGLATADWQVVAAGATPTPGPRNRSLPSIVTTSTGALVTTLGYRAEQNIPSATLFTQQTDATTSFGVGAFRKNVPLGVGGFNVSVTNTTLSYQADNTVGVKMFSIGPDCGLALALNGTTFLPGLMATTVEEGDATCSEHGIAAPECPYIVKSATAATPVIDGLFYWRACAEYVTQTGKTYRSLPSAAFAYKTLIADAVGYDVHVHEIAPTNKKNVKYSLYRTAYVENAVVQGSAQATTPPLSGGTTSLGFTSIFYKITNDLRPFYNDPAVSATTFLDLCNAANQAVGEVLYTDQGFLPRFPAPAFRSGAVWQNRAWLIGYDNALWFSGEIVPGQGEWFNPGFRIVLPTTEQITAVASLETFLLVFCESSIWYIPQGAALPDATGAGSIPVASRLPFEMGCTGFTSVIRQGCLYSSSNGGVWCLTRNLDNVWIGQAAQDELSPTITGMVVAGNYVCVATATGSPMNIVVYDTNLGAWATWTALTDNSAAVTLIAQSGGALIWSDDGRVFSQTPGVYLDAGSTYVAMTAVVSPVHIAGVRSWKRTWAIQVEGETYSPCALNVSLSYTDEQVTDFTYEPVQLAAAGLLEEEFRPDKQLSSSVGFTISDDEGEADPGDGRGVAIEVLGFYVGLEKGLKKGVARATGG